MLDASQIEQYERDGYLILRARFNDEEMARLDHAFDNNPPLDGLTGDAEYPAPGRYTLAKSCLKDPDFAFMAEHPNVVNPASDLLQDDVYLTAFVLYDRTPGGPGIPIHNDYKRWRPVGSSLNWLFSIIPMTDFDEVTGQLFIAPGSHQLDRVCDRGEGVLHINEASKPSPDDFIDPELKRGDLLLMNMHLWHRAAENKSDLHRVGLFNKYCAAHYPPATGYYLFDDDVHNILSDEGKKLLAVHSDKPIATTRLLLQRTLKEEREFFFVTDDNELVLPGGPTFQEQAIGDWDIGNYVAALQANIREQLRIETPWVSYIGDFEEASHLCRVYGYPMNNNGFPVPYREGKWIKESEVQAAMFKFGYEAEAVVKWLDPSMIRGKALTQAQSRIDQYAY
ncbi:MAG: phytanoyl-CoA dioxygenase family protein [Pseudomonadales bacterium]|jgi:hypothetical protein